MSENKGNNRILLTASILVCILRYMALLLPDWPFFSIWKNLEKSPQQYCLDFAIIVIFIINTYIVLKKREEEKTTILYWTEAVSFAAVVPAWRYMVNFVSWLETGELQEFNKVVGNIKGLLKVFLPLLFIVLMVVIIIWLSRNKDKIKEVACAFLKIVKKSSFIAQFIVILSIIHLIRLGIFLFGRNQLEKQILQGNGVGSMLVVAFLIALLMILLHCEKKKDAFTPAVWVGISLCLLGMAPIKNKIGKTITKILKFLQGYGLKRCLSLSVQFFLFLIMLLVFIVIIMLLIRGYQYFRTVKIRETKFWKICKKELQSGHRRIWLLFIIICLLFLVGAIIIFVKWTGTTNRFFQADDNIMQKLLQILGILISAIILTLFVVFTLCQMGAFLVRTLKEVDTLTEDDKKRYYMSHGTSGFLALILTLISWYIFTRFQFDEETLLGLAGSVFQYFALPVIIMIWYSIMFGIVDTIIRRESDESDEIIQQIEGHVYELSHNAINSIFAPFRLLFSYTDVLSEAMLDDDNDSDDNKRKITNNKKAYNNDKERKKSAKVKAVRGKDRKRLSEDKTCPIISGSRWTGGRRV